MKVYQEGDGFSTRHVVDGYDWASIPAGSTIVDLGGSHGVIPSIIVAKFPHISTVQNLMVTIASAQENVNGTPVQLISHDFSVHEP
jgi:tRNA1(Val) A37 N6-methylase TrmN6